MNQSFFFWVEIWTPSFFFWKYSIWLGQPALCFIGFKLENKHHLVENIHVRELSKLCRFFLVVSSRFKLHKGLYTSWAKPSIKISGLVHLILLAYNPCNARDNLILIHGGIWEFKLFFVSSFLIVHWIPISKIHIFNMKH